MTAPTTIASHCCAVCPRPIKPGFLMCLGHWRLVPHEEQQAVYRTWGRYRRTHHRSQYFLRSRIDYFAARDAAIASAQADLSTTSNGAPS